MKKSKYEIHCGYQVNYDDLSTAVARRAQVFVGQNPLGSIFLNPICTIVADEPNQEFFAALKKWQAKWYKDLSPSMRRQSRMRVGNYLSDKGRTMKRQRFFERAFSFTGVLFVNGEVIQPHRWKELGPQ